MVRKESFGQLKTHQEVSSFTLENELGMKVMVLDYGGIIKELWVPDEKGVLENVVLGYNNIGAYEENPAFLGAMIGPTAGRIEGGVLPIGGSFYQLEQNNNEHTLHGGSKGFHKQLMKSKIHENIESINVALEFEVPDLADGAPGDRHIRITYSLMKKQNTLSLFMEATTNKTTYMNITNHSYFNLCGKGNKDVINHEMTIYADRFGPVDKDMIPRNGWENVKGSPFDFRQSRVIGSALESRNNQIMNCQGIDHPFKLNKSESGIKLNKAAVLWDPISKRKMTVMTSYPHMVIYTGNFLDQVKVVNQEAMIKHQGICFEAQEVPNALYFSPERCQILKKDQHYSHIITYSFEIDT